MYIFLSLSMCLNIFFIFISDNCPETKPTAMKRIVIFFFVGSMILPLTAQRMIDGVSLTGRYGFPQEYTDTYTGGATEWGSINSITYAIQIAPKTKIPISFNHFYFHVNGDPGIPENLANPININAIILRTGWYQYFGNGNALQVLIAPRLMRRASRRR